MNTTKSGYVLPDPKDPILEMEQNTFIKVTSQMDKHVMYINKTYIMMLEKLANGSRIWVSGGDHGNVRIVNESVEELLEQMAVE